MRSRSRIELAFCSIRRKIKGECTSNWMEKSTPTERLTTSDARNTTPKIPESQPTSATESLLVRGQPARPA